MKTLATAERKGTPTDIETSVLLKSARRCSLCFHLSGDLREKLGQIAHLDQNPSNSAEDNLAFMCFDHHSLYDSTTSQHKNYTLSEVRASRRRLYEAILQNRHAAGSRSAATVVRPDSQERGVPSNALLKLKNLVNSLGDADHSWKKMFGTMDLSYSNMSRNEIMDKVFSTSDRDQLVMALETVKSMYGSKWGDPLKLQKFKTVCGAFGIRYEELL
jgi:hypothetical protein